MILPDSVCLSLTADSAIGLKLLPLIVGKNHNLHVELSQTWMFILEGHSHQTV